MKFNGFISAYADDIKIFGVAGQLLQDDIDKFSLWVKSNGLTINIKKSVCVSVGRVYSDCDYTVNGLSLIRSDSFKDLGVIFDYSFKFTTHLNKIKLSCYRLINLAFKVFVSKQPLLYLKFYSTYVLPLIDYCSPLYVNISCNNTNLIEKIQRFFTKRLYRRIYSSNIIPSYPDRLALFGLRCYEYRSKATDLTILYRMINGSLVVPGVVFTRSSHKPNRFILCRPSSSLQRDFFVHRTLSLWNKYLSNMQITSFHDFKHHLSTLSLSSFQTGSA